MGLFTQLKQRCGLIFRNSSRIHIRQHEINNLDDLVSLFDRFLDGNLSFPLEWDDFISWKPSKPEIQVIWNEVGNHEALLFSKNLADNERYRQVLLSIKNRIAKSIESTKL